MDGLRVGVTSSRRSEQLAEALRRRGAEVVVGPTLGGDRPEPDDVLAAAVDRLAEAGPDWFVATTGMGMRLWAEAAERTGRLDALEALVGGARAVARGAKAVGGLAKLGVEPEWTAPTETDAEVVTWLAERVRPGRTVAVQLHGNPVQHPYGRLAGTVDLMTVTPYRSVLPGDRGPARALITRVVDGDIDVVTFTSPGAVHGLFAIASDAGASVRAKLTDRLSTAVAVAAVGQVTAGACEHYGIPVSIVPDRPRTGDLIRAIETWAD